LYNSAVAAKNHLQSEQLRMFIPAKELMEHTPLDTVGANTFHEAHGMLARKRDKIRTNTTHSGYVGLGQSIAKEGVKEPVELRRISGVYDRSTQRRVSPEHESWAVSDGHSRVIAAYDANPNMEVPVIYQKPYQN